MPRLFSFLVAAAAASSVLGAAPTTHAVTEFDVSKCLGRWYEVYNGGALGQAPHQRESRCGSVDVGLSVLPHTLSLHYAHQLTTPHPHTHKKKKHTHRRLEEGEEESVSVVVRSVDAFVHIDPHKPSTLTLHTLHGRNSSLEVLGVGVGWEWVVLGSINGQDRLTVLARSVQDFQDQHDAQVRVLLSSLGLEVPHKSVDHQHCHDYEGQGRLDLSSPPHTVPSLDANAYTGRWLQVYANCLVLSSFERNGSCITADYALLPNGQGISVHNTQNMGSPTGAVSSIDGQAVASDPSKPAQLTVTFNNVPFPGQYWIIELGPIEKGQYQYSVVTDKYAQTLFILMRFILLSNHDCIIDKAIDSHHHLARDPVSFKRRFEARVLGEVRQLFTGPLHEPIETPQDASCVYSPVPSSLSSPSSPQRKRKLRQDNTHNKTTR